MTQLELETLITKYQKAYYDGNELISDAEFDKLWDELREKFPQSALLFEVGKDTISNNKIKHFMVMGSQDKFNNEEDFYKWLTSQNIQFPVIVEPKFDGCSIEIFYENGIFKYAATRGDGYYGEDISKAALSSNKIPTRVTSNPVGKPFTGSVRGEVILQRNIFKEKYSDFKNPRNFVAGALKNENFNHYEDFDFYIYDLYAPRNGFVLEEDKIKWINENEFQCTPYKLTYFPQDIIAIRNKLNSKFYSFNIDGIVLKQNIIDHRDLKELRPKKQRAFKWKDESAETTLLNIEWSQTGTTFTPVAIMDPVELDGSTIKKASLHNIDFLEKMQLEIGDTVRVVKHGCIIPGIVENVSKGIIK